VFADDAKLFRHVLSVNDCDTLQGGINTLHNWTKDWLLKLNVNKCKVVSFGKNVDNSYVYELIENNQSLHLARTDQITDLGILFDERLTFKEHINDKVNKAYFMLGIIKRNFIYLAVTIFTLLYKGMVGSLIDYCSSVWEPYKKGDIEMLESVQKRATKILSQHRHLSYTDRLTVYKLPTLHYTWRHDRGVQNNYWKIRGSSRAFQFAIRIDSIRCANLFESIRFVKKIGLSIH